ncbi:hypothetical protein D3C74_316180 [compost metagenome]
MPGVVEGLADHGDLAVHHARRRHDLRARLGERAGHRGVADEGRVVVHDQVAVRAGRQDPAVPVVGELVEAQVGHDDRSRSARAGSGVPGGVARDADGPVEDPVGGVGLRAGRVAVLGDAEQHDAADPGRGGLCDGLGEARLGVLHDARHGPERLGLGQALLDEQGEHEVGGVQPGLGDEPAHLRGRAQAAGTDHGRFLPSVGDGLSELGRGMARCASDNWSRGAGDVGVPV